jgi:hypothetical protein
MRKHLHETRAHSLGITLNIQVTLLECLPHFIKLQLCHVTGFKVCPHTPVIDFEVVTPPLAEEVLPRRVTLQARILHQLLSPTPTTRNPKPEARNPEPGRWNAGPGTRKHGETEEYRA